MITLSVITLSGFHCLLKIVLLAITICFYVLRYIDNVEVFCPDDACSNAPFASLPFGLIGSVSAFSNAVAFICGGSKTIYADCNAKVSGNLCSRNAECITTAGGTLWCTGPKQSSCYVYDRYLTRNWVKSAVSLITPRAFAASVLLPDGRVWVLGGAGPTDVLQTSEYVSVTESGISKITLGPNLQEPLMGHCAALVSASQIMVIGGFSTVTNDYSPTARIFDLTTEQWSTNAMTTIGGRMDSACLNVNIDGKQKVLMVGGWNNLALTDTAVYSTDNRRWMFYNGTGNALTPLTMPLRSSVLIGRNQTSILLGGVTCNSEGSSCWQTNKSEALKPRLINY
jgi:hypothetical protein